MTLIDRDELLKHEVMIITKGNAAFHGVPSSLIETAPVIDAMPEADPQEMARQLWRDAKKDPPDPNVDVIVYCSDGAILTAFMYDNGDWAENRECIPLDDVTHWMPNITGPELEEPEA